MKLTERKMGASLMGRWRQIPQTIIVGLVAITSSLLTQYLAGSQNQSLWKEQAAIEQKKLVFSEKIKLIEHFTIVINNQKRAQNLQMRLVTDNILAQAAINASKKKIDAGLKIEEFNAFQDSMNKTSSTQLELAKLNADFASTVVLIGLYFGDEVKAAASSLLQDRPWQDMDPKSFRTLLKLMLSEINPS